MSARDFFEQTKANGWPAVERWVADAVPESVTLDFKSAKIAADPDGLASSIAKAVSAFANVDGGVLVFGVECRSVAKGPDVVQSIEPVKGLAKFLDTVKQLAREGVEPTVAGLDVAAINHPTEGDFGVLLLFVPRSMGAPHRAERGEKGVKNIYFMRTADSTKVMPHRLLAAVFAAPPEPQLALELYWTSSPGTAFKLFVAARVRNLGPGTARSLRLKLTGCDADGAHNLGNWKSWSPWNINSRRGFFAEPGTLLYPDEDLMFGTHLLDESLIASRYLTFTGRLDSETSPPLLFDDLRVERGQCVQHSHSGTNRRPINQLEQALLGP